MSGTGMSGKKTPLDYRIHMQIPQFGAQARARLLFDKAPATCQAIWDQLENPLELKATHGMWTGPEISMQIPAAEAIEALSQIPPENQTVFPQPGALVWVYLAARVLAGMPTPPWPGTS